MFNIDEMHKECYLVQLWFHHPPEEHSHPRPAGGSVGRAGAHVLPVQLHLAAAALGAQHGAAEQTQGGVLPLVLLAMSTTSHSRILVETITVVNNNNKTHSTYRERFSKRLKTLHRGNSG